LSRRARELVENEFGYRVASGAFERLCLDALRKHGDGTRLR
jgi:hypothetical protein